MSKSWGNFHFWVNYPYKMRRRFKNSYSMEAFLPKLTDIYQIILKKDKDINGRMKLQVPPFLS